MMAGASIMKIRHQNLKIFAAGLLFSMAAAGNAGTVTHTVSADDTLWRVASKHGTTVESLRKLNGLKGNTIAPGQQLIVAESGKAAAKQAEKPVGSTATKTARHTSVTKTSVAHKKVATPVKESISPASKPQMDDEPQVASATKPVSRKTVASKGVPRLASDSAIVVDTTTGQTLYSKNVDEQKSIASITKLMTAMVSLDANPSMQEMITITQDDVDMLKHTHSRLPVGTTLPRYEITRLTLMSSENRAASSLSRNYPGGRTAFLAAMNRKAQQLGMTHSQFFDPTGLTPRNVSTAADLVKMVQAASRYELIHEFTTTSGREVALRPNSTPLQYKNSNALVREPNNDWDIKVSKTGYTEEAGRCLVMMATLANHPSVLVMLDSDGKLSPVGDANRLKDWIESGHSQVQLASR